MYCKKCGSLLKVGQKFCQNCGTPVMQAQAAGNRQIYRAASGAGTVYTGASVSYRQDRWTPFGVIGMTDRWAKISFSVSALILLVPLIVLLFLYTGLGGYSVGNTVYDKDGLTITYNSYQDDSGDIELRFNVINYTGRDIEAAVPIAATIDGKSVNLNEAGIFSQGLENGSRGTGTVFISYNSLLGDGISINNIKKIKCAFFIQYDLYGNLITEEIGPFTFNPR